jgi:hypothetical protein
MLAGGDQRALKLTTKEQEALMWDIILALPADEKKSYQDLAKMVPSGWSRIWENVARGLLLRRKNRVREDGRKLVVVGRPGGEKCIWRNA